jgi:predicted ATP-grasp superfamily ATP-dependent carboligase
MVAFELVLEIMMADSALELKEIPQAANMYMLIGWRQWADAGSISSGLPRYLTETNNARKIGTLNNDGFYLFQFPGTHDLVRPVVRFKNGFPESLQVPENTFYYTQIGDSGFVIFLGEEPHLDAERYIGSILDAAVKLNVKQMVGFGGVYAEVPYDKERSISSVYSQHTLRDELKKLSVNFSNYEGGASIGSYICRRAADRNLSYVSFYAFVPTFDLGNVIGSGNTMRLENDYMAWLNVMRRVNHLLKAGFDLSDLEEKSAKLVDVLDEKIEELDLHSPEAGLRSYFDTLSDAFDEVPFNPLGSVWENEISRLLDDEEAE